MPNKVSHEDKVVFEQVLIDSGLVHDRNATCPFCGRHSVFKKNHQVIVTTENPYGMLVEVTPVKHHGCISCLAVWTLR